MFRDCSELYIGRFYFIHFICTDKCTLYPVNTRVYMYNVNVYTYYIYIYFSSVTLKLVIH